VFVETVEGSEYFVFPNKGGPTRDGQQATANEGRVCKRHTDNNKRLSVYQMAAHPRSQYNSLDRLGTLKARQITNTSELAKGNL
jgi:hypothetical protein